MKEGQCSEFCILTFLERSIFMNALVKNTSMTACILAGALSAVVASAANAELLQLNYSFMGGGRINGVWTGYQRSTITAIIDTADRTSWSYNGSSGYRINHIKTYFSIDTIGSGEITTGLSTCSVTTDFMGGPNPLGVALALTGVDRPWYRFDSSTAPGWTMQGTLSEIMMDNYRGDLIKPVLNTTIGTWQPHDGYYSLYDAYFSATPAAVPAPGAFALVGLAGAFSGRRRRN